MASSSSAKCCAVIDHGFLFRWAGLVFPFPLFQMRWALELQESIKGKALEMNRARQGRNRMVAEAQGSLVTVNSNCIAICRARAVPGQFQPRRNGPLVVVAASPPPTTAPGVQRIEAGCTDTYHVSNTLLKNLKVVRAGAHPTVNGVLGAAA